MVKVSLENANIYVTRDAGVLHIAANEHYIGKVNCYNNWFTKFVTLFFGVASEVTFNGNKNKVYVVNKKEYEAKFSALTNNAKDIEANDSGTYMRDRLTPAKTDKLFKKMMHSFSEQNMEKVKRYIGKGADVDRNFWALFQMANISESEPYCGGNDDARRVGSLLFHAVRNKDALSIQNSHLVEFVSTFTSKDINIGIEHRGHSEYALSFDRDTKELYCIDNYRGERKKFS